MVGIILCDDDDDGDDGDVGGWDFDNDGDGGIVRGPPLDILRPFIPRPPLARRGIGFELLLPVMP